jgi:prevent-host-death family protein
LAIETSYTHLRDKLASVLNRVVDDQEVVVVRRKGSRDVALVPAASWQVSWRRLTCSVPPKTHSGY